MHYLEYNEQIQHRTGDFPLAYYPVNRHHPRYQMTMHWHRETELIRVGEGQLNLYIDDREIIARPGDLLLVAEGVLHGGDPADCEYECIVFDAGMLQYLEVCKRGVKQVLSHSVFLRGGVIEADAALSAAVHRLFALCDGGVKGRELNVLGALFDCFGCLGGLRDGTQLCVMSPRFGQKAEQLKPALEYIESHYGQPIPLETLARLTGMSAKYFCRFFRTIVHRSPIDYVNYYRVECASQFLTESDMTVAEIAQRCGYNDSSFFIKQFRRYKGTTPKKYRAG